MKDMRSKQIIVVQDLHMNEELVKGYMHEGYGVIEIPDFSTASKSSADYLITVMADEIEEFLKDGEQVVVLQTKKDRWTHQLLSKLSRRKLGVTVRDLP
jgi:23S rRNA pseudoU1915 N3-methylase RlmH